jgi:hypothetical protein
MIGHVLHGLTDAFAGMNAGENDRRLAGIGRRGDPRVDCGKRFEKLLPFTSW